MKKILSIILGIVGVVAAFLFFGGVIAFVVLVLVGVSILIFIVIILLALFSSDIKRYDSNIKRYEGYCSMGCGTYLIRITNDNDIDSDNLICDDCKGSKSPVLDVPFIDFEEV